MAQTVEEYPTYRNSEYTSKGGITWRRKPSVRSYEQVTAELEKIEPGHEMMGSWVVPDEMEDCEIPIH
ncbi:hypothetical protein PSPO01_11621 [Paraphaeosphaeria sporulosa]